MDITSLKFAALAIFSIIVFYVLNHKYRTAYLTLLSCGFIASFDHLLVLYVVVFSAVNYILGKKIPGSKYKLALYRTGIVINISQLGLLKYSSFTFDPVFRMLGSDILLSKLSEIIIPVGISYFTLQGIGYLINIKMGWEKPENNFLDFLLYISFFPKFLSGPVERSNHFLPQIKTVTTFNEHQVSEGLRIALFGFFKKIAIANQMAPFIIKTYSDVGSSDGSALWVLLLLQPLYLYFDFSGYTDIAIGFAKTFGFNLLPNFNKPFFSENVTIFWKKFHISLSSWFNDYVFRQVSFRRRKWGIYASSYAILITFVLFGIWHGAGWNFMVLGFLQALAINYEFFTKKWRVNFFKNLPGPLNIWISRLLTYLFYGSSLVFFFSPDLSSSLVFFSRLFEINSPILLVIIKGIPYSALIFIVIYLFIEYLNTDFPKYADRIREIWAKENLKNTTFRWTIYYLILAILFVLGNQVQQFIYVQF